MLTGCNSKDYSFKYDTKMNSTAYMLSSTTTDNGVLAPFASDLCVDDEDLYGIKPLLENSYAYGLYDVNDCIVLSGENMYEQLHPASLTKIMTALVALKYGNLDDEITVGNCEITESGAQVFGFEQGDRINLDQALNVLLLYSANDVGLIIADHVGGNQEAFINMMNEEAKALGCTHTHFTNPHGLTNEEHYTCVYDLYLMFNEALKYDRFKEIIQQSSYRSNYNSATGEVKLIDIGTTNLFLKGNYTAPEGITVLGGKTGTTNAALSCLAIYSMDKNGNPYISIILKAETRDILYKDMTSVLDSIQ